MTLTLFMAATAAAYAWYVHGWFWAVVVGLLMVTLVPKALWIVVGWRLGQVPDASEKTIIDEYRIARRLSWWTWIGVLLLIGLSGSFA